MTMLVPDARVEEGVHRVHEEVHAHHHRDDDEVHALDHRIVPLVDGVEEEAAHAGQAEDRHATLAVLELAERERELDEGEVVLLHLEGKIYYSLNLTGERIWQGLKEGLSLNEISRRLQEEFDVDGDRADRSVLNLVNELSAQKLVEIDK